MPTAVRKPLLLLPDPFLARAKAALATSAVPFHAAVANDPGAALAAFAAEVVDLVVLGERPDAADVCRLFRSLRVPTILLSGATGPLQINAARKASGATIALGASFGDADLLAAMRTVTADLPEPGAPREAVQMPPPTPAVETDPAWTLARYCLRNSTGFLRIGARNGTAECTVVMDGGSPVAALTNVKGPRLGEVLVLKKRLTPDQVERALKVAERKSLRLGVVLADQGVITPAEISREVSAQYVSRVLQVFAWPAVASTVRFEAIPPDDARIPLTREGLLLEGLRRQYPAPRLKSLLDPTAVYELSPDASRRLALFGFNAKEVAVFAWVDGARPLSELVLRAGSVEDAQRAMYAAIALDLVRPRRPPR